MIANTAALRACARAMVVHARHDAGAGVSVRRQGASRRETAVEMEVRDECGDARPGQLPRTQATVSSQVDMMRWMWMHAASPAGMKAGPLRPARAAEGLGMTRGREAFPARCRMGRMA
jgi:hypothetical protein